MGRSLRRVDIVRSLLVGRFPVFSKRTLARRYHARATQSHAYAIRHTGYRIIPRLTCVIRALAYLDLRYDDLARLGDSRSLSLYARAALGRRGRRGGRPMASPRERASHRLSHQVLAERKVPPQAGRKPLLCRVRTARTCRPACSPWPTPLWLASMTAVASIAVPRRASLGTHERSPRPVPCPLPGPLCCRAPHRKNALLRSLLGPTARR
mmetsp:Transcript_4169/g.13757  ORF Transcript_4169/g.13757 Transcript_4169/m.13757 type:complete len:210 (+) Transcript_4169:256-885(+)